MRDRKGGIIRNRAQIAKIVQIPQFVIDAPLSCLYHFQRFVVPLHSERKTTSSFEVETRNAHLELAKTAREKEAKTEGRFLFDAKHAVEGILPKGRWRTSFQRVPQKRHGGF